MEWISGDFWAVDSLSCPFCHHFASMFRPICWVIRCDFMEKLFLRFCRAQVSQSRIILGCGRARRIWGKNESLEKLQGARLEKSWSKSWNTQEPGGQKLSLLTGFLILLMIEWFSLPEWFKEVWGMELLNVVSWGGNLERCLTWLTAFREWDRSNILWN